MAEQRLDVGEVVGAAREQRRRDAAINASMGSYVELLSRAWAAVQQVFGEERATAGDAFRLVDAWLKLSEAPKR
jgi:hypothetical protein